MPPFRYSQFVRDTWLHQIVYGSAQIDFIQLSIWRMLRPVSLRSLSILLMLSYYTTVYIYIYI